MCLSFIDRFAACCCRGTGKILHLTTSGGTRAQGRSMSDRPCIVAERQIPSHYEAVNSLKQHLRLVTTFFG